MKDFIFKADTELPYTIIPNMISGSLTLSWESKGLLCFLLSLPKGWVINKSWLSKKFRAKRTVVDRIFKELESEGYILSFDIANCKGRFNAKGYKVYSVSSNYEGDKNHVFYRVENQHRLDEVKETSESYLVKMKNSRG